MSEIRLKLVGLPASASDVPVELSQRLDRVRLNRGQHVHIGIDREHRISVAKSFLNRLQVGTSLQEMACVGVDRI